jgi:hypothetical protein
MKLFPEKSHAAILAWSQRRNRGLDEATKAGIGAIVCSMLLLTILFLVMHTLPISIG